MTTANATPTPEQRQRLQNAPGTAPVMFQEWKKLLFLHWKIEPEILAEKLPEGLFLDTYEGETWIGVVPFFMRNIRPRFLPAVPGISNFLELNVRTYVTDQNGTPGVWFFSLDANQRLVCFLGRSLFKLAYRDANMTAEEQDDWISYSALRHGESKPASYRYRGLGEAQSAKPGSLEFFLVERYLLYSHCVKTGRFFRGRVHHPPYRFQNAEVESFSDLPATWNGLSMPGGQPDHTAFVDSVKVRIFGVESITM